jgi:outer membrane protein
MKGLIIITVAALLATELSAKESFTMGYVDLQKALQTVEAGKNAKSTLEKEVSGKKAELEKQQKDFQKEAEQFEKKSAILNDSAKAAKQAELQKRYVDLQKLAAESQMELQKRERDLTKPIVDELKGIVEGLGKEKDYQFIVEKNEGAVLYAQAGSDLTTEVISRYNTKNKGKASAKKK